MPIDPSIAMGYRGLGELPNPMNQMAQIAQLQQSMNQNELAQSQLRTTKRAEEAQNLLGKAYAGLDFSGAGGAGAPAGQSPYAAMKAQVVKSLAGTGRADLIPSELAKIDEMQHKATVNQEVAGKVEKQARDVVDYTWKQYQSEVPKVTDAAGVERWTRAAYKDPLLGPIVSKFKPEEQAVSDALNLINQPGGLNRWIAKHMGMSADKMIDMLKTTTRTTNLNDVSRAQTEDFFGNPVGPAVDTPMGVSPNTTAQINAARKNHLENLAQQGWTFDTERGIAVNARQGISRPISTLMAPVGGGFSAAPVVGGAPVAAPSIAASGGGVPGQRQAPAGQPVAGVLGPKQTRIAPNELRDEVNALTKDFRVVQDAHTKIKNVANTGAGDMSLLYSFIKLLDPGSVVRESEFAAAAQSGSYGERVQGAVNRALTGQRLPDSLRQDFIREADNLYKSQKAGTDRVIKHYTGIAERAGLNPQDVIFPYAAPEIVIPEQAPAGAVRLKGK